MEGLSDLRSPHGFLRFTRRFPSPSILADQGGPWLPSGISHLPRSSSSRTLLKFSNRYAIGERIIQTRRDEKPRTRPVMALAMQPYLFDTRLQCQAHSRDGNAKTRVPVGSAQGSEGIAQVSGVNSRYARDPRTAFAYNTP